MAREKQVHLDGVTEDELIVFRSECVINLHMVPFEVFRSQIKRYGYATDLTDKHMRQISGAIMLDCDEMYEMRRATLHLSTWILHSARKTSDIAFASCFVSAGSLACSGTRKSSTMSSGT